MAKRTTEAKLDQLGNLNVSNSDPAALAALKKALQDKNNLVVAKAAHLCREHTVADYVAELKTAFQYFADHPDKDKGCFAKKALVQALYALDHDDSGFYQQAVTLRQGEPVWGGSVDSAVDVRCWAALGLTLARDPRVVFDLLPLLYDSEAQARLGAVKAIACLPPTTAELLLRTKVLAGDGDAYVIGECFHQLISIEPDFSVPFVESYLTDLDQEILEYAALALGQCHHLDAFMALKQAYEKSVFDMARRYCLKALSLHRSREALDFLLDLLPQVSASEGAFIVEALSIHKHRQDIRERLRETVAGSTSSALREALEQRWDG